MLPDSDLALFYLRASASVNHHSYLAYRPMFWLGLLLVGLILRKFKSGHRIGCIAAGAVLHMVSDTVVGEIVWGWPI